MGQSSDQIRQEIDAKRDDAAQKIDQLQAQVMDTTEQLRDQAQGVVDDSIQSVKESLDVRQQIEDHPLVALGAAFVAGIALGGITSGGDRQQQPRSPRSSGSSSAGGFDLGEVQSGASNVASGLRDLAHKSGLDETLSNAAAAFIGNLTEQFKDTLDRNFPGFSEKMASAERTQGGFSQKSHATQHEAATSGSDQVYTTRSV